MAQVVRSGTGKHPGFVPGEAMWFAADGLHIGALHVADHAACERRQVEGSDRLATMLALAFDNRLSPRQLASLASAGATACGGDIALANIRLAHAGLATVRSARALRERFAAAHFLLDEGMPADELLTAVGIGPDWPILTKTDQPRVPAGSGRESGRWTSNGEPGSGSSAAAAVAAAGIATPLADAAPSFLATGAGAEALAALSTFALALGGAAAVFGTLFVPTPNTTVTSGPLPGGDSLTYEYNRDEGMLRLRGADGRIVAGGPRDHAGIFRDADTGIAIGRDLGGTLVFDQVAMTAVADDAGAIPRAKADVKADENNEPKLCPDPAPEPDNKASPRAKAYQEQISALVNPQRPLPYGLAVAFFNPTAGKWVRLDECDEADGALIEAKGPGFAKSLRYEVFQESFREDFLKQATSQVEAAGSRSIRWYFAEKETAEFASQLFEDDDELAGKIQIIVHEALVR